MLIFKLSKMRQILNLKMALINSGLESMVNDTKLLPKMFVTITRIIRYSLCQSIHVFFK